MVDPWSPPSSGHKARAHWWQRTAEGFSRQHGERSALTVWPSMWPTGKGIFMKVSNLADAAPVFLIHIRSKVNLKTTEIPEMGQRDTKKRQEPELKHCKRT